MGLFAMQGCGGGIVTSTASTPVSNGNGTSNGSAALKQSQLGYVWLPKEGDLRPMLGVMGAAYLGASLTPQGSYVAGAASPVSQVALLVGQGGQVSRIALENGTWTSLAVVSGTGLRVRFSPSGTAAVVFAPGSTSATLFTGLLTTVQTTSLTAGSALQDAAVSDAGSVAALLQVGAKVVVAVLHTSGTASSVATLSGPGALSFVGTGDDLLTVDSAANTLILVHTVSTAPSPVTVGTSNLLKTPTAVGAAATGRWAVAVNSAESSVVRVDLTGQTAPQRLLCPVQPLFAEPLAYGAFRFSEAGGAPVWLTDITATTPTMFFVPALPNVGASGA